MRPTRIGIRARVPFGHDRIFLAIIIIIIIIIVELGQIRKKKESNEPSQMTQIYFVRNIFLIF